jgi:hypothetical protein
MQFGSTIVMKMPMTKLGLAKVSSCMANRSEYALPLMSKIGSGAQAGSL